MRDLHINYKEVLAVVLAAKGRGQKKGFATDSDFGGSCVPKPLPLEDSNTTGVPQAARKTKRTKIEGQ